MYYEANHKIFVGTSETFTGVLHNNTAISGLGVVSSCWNIPDEDDSKSTLCFVMKHVDYQPQVTGVSPCTGNEGTSGKKIDPAGSVTPAGRVRPAKHIPSPNTPTNAVAGPSSTPSAKRKLASEEVPLKSPSLPARRARPAKLIKNIRHVPKPAVTPAKASRLPPKGKGKTSAALPPQVSTAAQDEENISDEEWPVSPVPPVTKKSAPKKTPASKSKKGKAPAKATEVESECPEEPSELIEADTDEDVEE
ncbi:uncharacterized protein MELLADRAFT_60363 [Melampsora larici-populina 98AG31]|uniref:Uncharacterized protein n=1 Tax=Melampsora larici-populina (strain 98AG31 / pathotype 3-4-7) TaxID=747676 RepID=F4R9U4_MELLP|nr:uncharacterized protein MELLADRAFT_60363 [Melampsora larici-populina 98AG31]EGG10673.1 hypothetical protein MELLADRAFT_60363 [Melampsora larici-populina 98AG31]